jgi:predicted N-formylglutamate amidohydrolase
MPGGLRPAARERAILRDHWGWDPGAWDVTLGLARALDAGAVGGRWSRLLVDLNRRVDEPTLVRVEVEGAPLSWNRRVGAAERERRVRAYHAPYHDEIDRQIVRRVVRGVRPFVLAVHSFVGRWNGRERGFDLGVLYDRHRACAQRFARALRAAGFRVRYNEPYSGKRGLMYAAHRHGTHHDLPCLELELNQDLISDRRAADRVAHAVAPAVASMLRES